METLVAPNAFRPPQAEAGRAHPAKDVKEDENKAAAAESSAGSEITPEGAAAHPLARDAWRRAIYH